MPTNQEKGIKPRYKCQKCGTEKKVSLDKVVLMMLKEKHATVNEIAKELKLDKEVIKTTIIKLKHDGLM